MTARWAAGDRGAGPSSSALRPTRGAAPPPRQAPKHPHPGRIPRLRRRQSVTGVLNEFLRLTPVRGPAYHPPDEERAMRRWALGAFVCL